MNQKEKKLVIRCAVETGQTPLTVICFDPHETCPRAHLWTTTTPDEGVVLSRKDMKRLRDYLNDLLERDP